MMKAVMVCEEREGVGDVYVNENTNKKRINNVCCNACRSCIVTRNEKKDQKHQNIYIYIYSID